MAHHSQWGPSGLIVEQIVRRAAKLTPDESERLFTAWANEARSVDAAWGFVCKVVRYEDRPAAEAGRAAAAAAVEAAARAGALLSGSGAARDAAYVAAISDLAEDGGELDRSIREIMGPWLQVIGDPRINPVCGCGRRAISFDEANRLHKRWAADPWTRPVSEPATAVTIDLGPIAPQPGDRFPWLVMAVARPEPLIIGYAATEAEAFELAEDEDGPVVMWRAGKEES